MGEAACGAGHCEYGHVGLDVGSLGGLCAMIDGGGGQRELGVMMEVE